MTFTVEVSPTADPGRVTQQSVTVTTVNTDLVAVIDGGSERTVGVDSGELVLDGSGSYDPDREEEEMTFFWTCHKVSERISNHS